jgi:arylsulfatase A-like enzyme
MPTCADLAGTAAPLGLDGISIVPTLLHYRSTQKKHGSLYWEFYELGGSRAVRMDDWKAVCRPYEGRVELYNLATDPGELADVASRHEDIVGRACAAMHNAHTPSTLWPIPRRNELEPYPLAKPATPRKNRRPNVVLIITDDQGYGDLGVHGNDKIRTPNLDRLAGESVRLTRFYVCPVCSPTRASLMTGRYNYRTGVVDTFLGRSLMYPDEVTLPERLRGAGYRTGIFGKWHLGDNYPLRAIDQGFQEALVCLGGGIGQPSDPEGNTYQDPILQQNGKPERRSGYCTDIFTDEAIRFIEKNREKPFYVHLSTNAPHVPLEVADNLVAPYRAMGLDEVTAKVYAMVTNIDDNVGRLLAKLDDLGLQRDTIVIFMSDNGAQQARFNTGLRGLKGSVYEGGIRAPCFIRWPGELTPRAVDRVAAHIDVGPTILDLCSVRSGYGTKVDGRSLLPLLHGSSTSWPDRTIYTQWHRGNVPVKFRNCAAISQQYKLIDGKELYDLAADPTESKNIATIHPDIAARLLSGYEAWFDDVSSTRGYDPPRIVLGDRAENSVMLSRQDWRGPWASWSPDGLGYWEVRVARSGRYKITLALWPPTAPATIHTRIKGVYAIKNASAGDRVSVFDHIRLTAGPGRLEAWAGSSVKAVGIRYVVVEREK